MYKPFVLSYIHFMQDLLIDDNEELRAQYVNAEAEISAKWANVIIE
jgi:hypothetical protein